MKDIVISAERVRRELIVISACFVLAFGLNVFSVIFYVKPWHEIFSQIGYVVVITAVFYVVALIFRILFWICKKLIRK